MWALGKGPLYSIKGLNLKDNDNGMKCKNYCAILVLLHSLHTLHTTIYSFVGFVRTRLLKVEDLPVPPADTFPIKISHDLDLAADDTTYWCSVHKLPEQLRRKHHVVQVCSSLVVILVHHISPILRCQQYLPSVYFSWPIIALEKRITVEDAIVFSSCLSCLMFLCRVGIENETCSKLTPKKSLIIPILSR